ncbi:hypothetical protein K474DRAFT_1671406 [Panus rudis PR-1116 ss-1]|nr:hypothetical protein K474DRAFT_1671406 [Panus rudis PR-1116 ss-1]
MAQAQAQAYQQAYAMAPANKGTLVPGQMITVNKYTVQVERYLSQGGFAHVYLVKSSTPIYNTTSHVLKRIAIANEAMLSEVKKEVDIMRLLKGHPNIVYLIDAAWHRMSNGTYEVFILMEFCSGGGIIDMMNRRLRERLTEPEILTIFADVCEGLAAMHALKPPLLHRDLKVENILQASETTFKLCDFGSATPVQKVPSTTQEIRALEADLNRHTTLQYRAPEMVDVYQRRPIDEKSDVWALGVLLYKLCYYTTPFEEHGPLAILNVQYKFPSYPIYSQNMLNLIASMLREHGTQRPSVFEILNHVHALRGTKPKFSYHIPSKQPPLSPRGVQSTPLQTLSPNVLPSSQLNPLDDLVSYKSRQSPTKNAGQEARDKVLEAIAPMRRGRPTSALLSPPSPRKEGGVPLGSDMRFGSEGDRAWNGVRGHKSGQAAIGGSSGAFKQATDSVDAWGINVRDKDMAHKDHEKGFDNDFSSLTKGFGDSFQPSRSPVPSSLQSSKGQVQGVPQPQPISIPRPSPSPGLTMPPPRSPSKPAPSPSPRMRPKDAFEGLGLSSQPPPPTLAEARKIRTGAGVQSTGQDSSSSRSKTQNNSTPSNTLGVGLGTSNTMYRPPSSHSPLPSTSSKSFSSQSHEAPTSGKLGRAPSRPGELSAEERFPSLEELDREFAAPSHTPPTRHKPPHPSLQPAPPGKQPDKPLNTRPPSRGGRTRDLLAVNGTGGGPAAGNRFDGVKSQQVTGSAMRESRMVSSRQPSTNYAPGDYLSGGRDVSSPTSPVPLRPMLNRKHRSSLTIKPTQPPNSDSAELISLDPSASTQAPPALPPRPSPGPQPEPRDWLTGVSDDETPSGQPVLRDSPSKRASFFERSPVQLQKPLEAVTGEQDWPTPADIEREIEQEREQERRKQEERRTREKSRERQRERESVREVERERQRERRREKEKEQQKEQEKKARSGGSSAQSTKAFITRTGTGSQARERNLSTQPLTTKPTSQSSTAPSPTGLTSNWSPIESPKPLSSSSSSDDGPEDLNGYRPKADEKGPVKQSNDARGVEARPDGSRKRRTKSKGRQSSVHDLVDLWGGGVDKNKDAPRPKSPEKRSSVIVPTASTKPSPVPFSISSPQPLISALATGPASTSSRFLPPRPPSSQQHKKEASSSKPPPGSRALPGLTQAPSSGRSRPQSMFINTTNKSAANNVTASDSTPQQTLSPPAPDAQAKRSSRRSSISDMVQKYEAFNAGGKPGPGVPLKPAALKIAATGGGSGPGGISSPSSAALRFPKLSPPSSPVVSKANLSVPEDNGPATGGSSSRDNSKGRTSPAPSISGLPTKSSESSNATGVNGLPRRSSPLFTRKPSPAIPDNTSQNTNTLPPLKSITPPDEAPISSGAVGGLRSPSPEKPYQGGSGLRRITLVEHLSMDTWGKLLIQAITRVSIKQVI